MRCYDCNAEHPTYRHADIVGTVSPDAVPVFGRDRLPEGKRWDTRPPQWSYVTSDAAWSRYIGKARKESAGA